MRKSKAKLETTSIDKDDLGYEEEYEENGLCDFVPGTPVAEFNFDESLKDLMIEFCGEEKVEQFENNKFIAYFPFVENDYMYSYLLRFGDKCVCLEPENIRLEFIKRIKNLLNAYEMYENIEG